MKYSTGSRDDSSTAASGWYVAPPSSGLGRITMRVGTSGTVTSIAPSVDDSRGGGGDIRTKHCLGSLAIPPTPEVAMHLSPADTEKLLLSVAGMVARDRLARGVKLNHPETVALLSTWVLERAREGALVADLMEQGRTVLRRQDVMDGVAEMITDVQVEATFPDGRKLVTLHHPIA